MTLELTIFQTGCQPCSSLCVPVFSLFNAPELFLRLTHSPTAGLFKAVFFGLYIASTPSELVDF